MMGAGTTVRVRSQRVAAEAIPVSDLPVPRGWFAVATSADLPRGRVVRAKIDSEELVIWRTDKGSLCAASAWCPHLGAHLGRVGRVRGEQLECGFHGFRFGVDGHCQATGYGGRVPGRATLRTRQVRETGGVVFGWLDPGGGSPSFEIPDIDLAGWARPVWRKMTFAGHPLETTENSVDFGHLGWMHGYDAVAELEPAHVENATLRARYQMTRGGRSSGLRLPTVRTVFDVSVYGLGVSIVDLTVLTLGVRQRLFVLPTPVGDGMVTLRLGVSGSLEPLESMPKALRHLPPALLAPVLSQFTMLGLYYDVAQDRRIWVTKRHVRFPVLVDGDGPIGLYRHWASQFLDY
jgi:cholesterol 7-desaturase